MSPSEFNFKLTVPNDPEGATVVAVVATHAVGYANIDEAAGAAFVETVRNAAAQALKGAAGSHTQVVFGAAGGQLTVTFGGQQSVSHPLPS
jgi:class 3 adenylate cyclase